MLPNQLLFPAPPVAAVAVRGRPERIAIRRIFCVGPNDEAHARERGVAVDGDAPFYFTKSAEHYVAWARPLSACRQTARSRACSAVPAGWT
jgi:2-keto-4-pentenoate hydratase/2-oxohepta-3-ene-1,7-dioic acid hydratase in catechol pathway